jgi:hypothetical protein
LFSKLYGLAHYWYCFAAFKTNTQMISDRPWLHADLFYRSLQFIKPTESGQPTHNFGPHSCSWNSPNKMKPDCQKKWNKTTTQNFGPHDYSCRWNSPNKMKLDSLGCYSSNINNLLILFTFKTMAVEKSDNTRKFIFYQLITVKWLK